MNYFSVKEFLEVIEQFPKNPEEIMEQAFIFNNLKKQIAALKKLVDACYAKHKEQAYDSKLIPISRAYQEGAQDAYSHIRNELEDIL